MWILFCVGFFSLELHLNLKSSFFTLIHAIVCDTVSFKEQKGVTQSGK